MKVKVMCRGKILVGDERDAALWRAYRAGNLEGQLEPTTIRSGCDWRPTFNTDASFATGVKEHAEEREHYEYEIQVIKP